MSRGAEVNPHANCFDIPFQYVSAAALKIFPSKFFKFFNAIAIFDLKVK